MVIQRILPRFLLLSAAALVLLAPAAVAQDGLTWSVSAGVANTHGDDNPFEVGLELRLKPWMSWPKASLAPAFGLTGTEKGAIWAHGGLRLDWEIAESWIVTPQFAVTAYEKGDDLDLGGVLEFRSGIEIAHKLESGARFGVLFFHLSNARIYDTNPGSNSLVLTWTFGR